MGWDQLGDKGEEEECDGKEDESECSVIQLHDVRSADAQSPSRALGTWSQLHLSR